MTVKYVLYAREKKSKIFLTHGKVCKRPSTTCTRLPPKSAKKPENWVFRQRVTELQTNIFKKIALHFAPFMI